VIVFLVAPLGVHLNRVVMVRWIVSPFLNIFDPSQLTLVMSQYPRHLAW
jgi:hypothetical protein